jgi:hypothetical protein
VWLVNCQRTTCNKTTLLRPLFSVQVRLRQIETRQRELEVRGKAIMKMKSFWLFDLDRERALANSDDESDDDFPSLKELSGLPGSRTFAAFTRTMKKTTSLRSAKIISGSVAQCSSLTAAYETRPDSRYISKALCMLLHVLFEFSLTSVQCLVLLTIYYSSMVKSCQAHDYILMASSKAQAIFKW